ncbi:DUF6292 family protein [Actinosynnema pretiosum]|uniref:DUF6292 family protein n=1 Tax=Actinosynnema pretiosum TaxID=42197 RepID=UPI0012FD747F|nr:DUF6292 family protein [Actinosynnema pretiosum]
MTRSRTSTRPGPRNSFPPRREGRSREDVPARGGVPARGAGQERAPLPRRTPAAWPGVPAQAGPERSAEDGGDAVRHDGAHVLADALADYVQVVAEAVGVSIEGTSFEVTDTATAYLALGERAEAHPGRDLMLVWSAPSGWVVSVETRPGEEPVVLSRPAGDLVPAPEAVAELVAEAVAGGTGGGRPLALVREADWAGLAGRMRRRARAR